ncbi:MAG: LytR C-terminal domain-containing protein [Pseudonocardia sp.]|nr:LytR C-terminal domain-containing protein [Pseudonocardia sp.]
MTAPAPSGGPSPLRLGGLALIGVGVIAAVIGVATLATGGGSEDPTVAAPPPASSQAAPAPETTTTNPNAVPVPSFTPTPGADGSSGAGTGGTGPGGTEPGGAGTGANGQAGAGSDQPSSGQAGTAGVGTAGAGGTGPGRVALAPMEPLRVYNNSTIPGLAAKAAEDFRRAGWTVTESRNYSEGVIPTSTVYYRPGTGEQASAERLATEFGLRAEPRFAGIQDATPGLIVIVTKDYRNAANS